MAARPCRNDVLSIDLAFDASGAELSETSSLRLNEEQTWIKHLQLWIETIRADTDLACPAVVRDTAAVSLGLTLSDDATLKELNTNWRQRDTATDVLSFAALDDAPDIHADPCIELGDIVVSVQTARRQAIEQNHSLERELRWLVSHGLLHLLGWDHPDPETLQQMLAIQERLLDISGNVQARGHFPVDVDSNLDGH